MCPPPYGKNPGYVQPELYIPISIPKQNKYLIRKFLFILAIILLYTILFIKYLPLK